MLMRAACRQGARTVHCNATSECVTDWFLAGATLTLYARCHDCIVKRTGPFPTRHVATGSLRSRSGHCMDHVLER